LRNFTELRQSDKVNFFGSTEGWLDFRQNIVFFLFGGNIQNLGIAYFMTDSYKWANVWAAIFSHFWLENRSLSNIWI